MILANVVFASRVVALSLLVLAACGSQAPVVVAPAVLTRPIAPPTVVSRVDALMQPWNRDDAPGCSVALVSGGKVLHARGYGLANLEHGIANDANTAFDLASTSKQFTAAALQLLVTAGRVTLEDDVRRYLPELPSSYELNDGVVTIGQLLHHTSGLRDYGRLMSLAGFGLGPVTSTDALDMLRRQRGLLFTPGTQHVYSNTGYFVLSQVIERASGQRFAQYVDERLFRPLGMQDSRVRDDLTRVIPNRATGYVQDSTGVFRVEESHWETVGDSSVSSTVLDLARFATNFRTLNVGDATWAASMVNPGTLASGETLSYASGLMLGTCRGLPTVSHSRRSAGFRAELLRFPTKEVSAVVLCNTAHADASRLGLGIAAIALEWQGERSQASCVNAEASNVSNSTAEACVGVYGDPLSGMRFDITHEGEHLVARAASKYILSTVDERHFLLDGGPRLLPMEFDGRAPHRTLTLPGGVVLHEQAPRAAYAPNERSLASYAGRYHSEELGVSWELTHKQDVLELSGRHMGGNLVPIGPDEFSLDETSAGGALVFQYGPRGITGFRLTEGPASGVTFIRIYSNSTGGETKPLPLSKE